jgi:hypothetical protein
VRDNPRYSIIPAGAVTDRRLEGRDLQVLCLLGCHSDKLGWVDASSQASLASMVDCSRQSLQRSIARLVTAGWVQTKTSFVSETGRPYAPYAYRVLMDQDDPDPEVPKYEVEPPERDGVPTGGQGCPPAAGTGCPNIRGHQEELRPVVRDLVVVESPCAREPLISNEAIRVAEAIGAIAGLPDPQVWPPGWCGSALRVDAFLREGFHPDLLIIAAREVMAGRKTKDPPWSIAYFEKAFAKARGRQLCPIPIVETIEPQKVVIHEQTKPDGIAQAGDRRIAQLQQQLADQRAARAGHREGAVRLRACDDDVQVLPAGRRGGPADVS